MYPEGVGPGSFRRATLLPLLPEIVKAQEHGPCPSYQATATQPGAGVLHPAIS